MPTNTENVEIFEKTLIGGLSCIKTHLAFDINILLPKNKDGMKKTNPKVLYKIRNEKTNVYKDKRIVSKILKMDKNNQYGNAMTKPLPTDVIKKQQKNPSLRELNLLI